MKHRTSQTALMLLLAATVIAWTSCHTPEPEKPHCCKIDGLYKHIIPGDSAAMFQNRFIKAYDSLKKITPEAFLARHFRIPNAETFSKGALCALINYEHIDSVRIFYGEDTTGKFRLVIQGVDRYGKIVKIKFPRNNAAVSDTVKSSTKPGTDDGEALENGQTCPPCLVNEDPQ